MNGIEYLYTEGKIGDRLTAVPVRISGSTTIVGEIRPVDGGWQYLPKQQKTGSDVFATMAECQRDIEGDNSQ